MCLLPFIEHLLCVCCPLLSTSWLSTFELLFRANKVSLSIYCMLTFIDPYCV